MLPTTGWLGLAAALAMTAAAGCDQQDPQGSDSQRLEGQTAPNAAPAGPEAAEAGPETPAATDTAN